MKSKTTSLLTTAVILLLLVLAGPAQGFVLNLALNNHNPTQGQTITFTAQIDAPAGEQLPISQLTLQLNGPTPTSCTFTPNGNLISGCPGITIAVVNQPNNGYGYGYNYGYNYGYFGYGYNWGYGYGYAGKLIYTITLDTNQYDAGSYTTQFKVKIKNNEFSQNGPDFTITESQDQAHRSCRTNWQCSQWSSCSGGFQTRTCEKIKPQCAPREKPAEIKICSRTPTSPAENQLQNLALDNQNQNEEQRTENTNEQTLTGTVTGVIDSVVNLGKTFVGVVLIALCLLVLTTLVILKLKTRTKKSFY